MADFEFDQVYRDTKELVWKLVSRYVFTREDREDLFQEIFLNIYSALPKFRGDSRVNTWLYRIAVNCSINYVKKQGRIRRLLRILEGLRLIEESPPAEIAEVSVPLAKLNPQQRMVLLLAEVEEKPLEEIAQTMGIPVGTVKSNLHRAKEIIKKEVRKDGSVFQLYPEIETNCAEG